MSKPIVKNATTGSELLWRSIRIKKSLDEICHSLELEIPASERLKVRRHNRLEVCCKNDLVKDSGGERRVTTVLVDEVTSTADVAKNSLMVTGRSPARDIIDSTWSDDDDNFDYNDRKLGEIIQNIGSKFGIKCFVFPTNKPDSSDTVPFFAFENESPWNKLIDEADQQGFILTSNEAGNLYLWRVQAAVRKEPFHITEGINIKSVKWTENGSEQYHEYVVKGGGHEPVRKIDGTCPGNRILTIDIDDPDVTETELESRGVTEMRRRKETKVIVSVPGWGLTNDQIKYLGETNGMEVYWVPNILIPVKVPSLGLNANLLVSEVEQSATPESMSSDITLVNREMYL